VLASLGIDMPTAVLLCLAILLALSFEFVNGFHDTANAVATVIYTHALKPTQAVVWSGMWNLIGLESRHLVSRATSFQLAHADRFDCRCRFDEFLDEPG
jgi:phosphate/sulfate permease